MVFPSLAALREWGRDRRGVTAVEYGLIAAMTVAVGLSVFNLIGDRLHQDVNCVLENMDGAQQSAACSGGGSTNPS